MRRERGGGAGGGVVLVGARKTIILPIALLGVMTVHAESRFVVSGQIATARNNCILRLTVRNDSTQAVTLYRFSLPWANTYSTRIVALPAEGYGAPLQQTAFPIMDPTNSKVVLRPGQEIAGDIQLESRFDGLGELLHKGDVIVFWTYLLEDEALTGGKQRFGGWALVPKLK